MAVFKRLSKEEIKQDYDHYGLMYGIVPVYVGDAYGDCRICVRNWIPEWTLDLGDAIFDIAVSFMTIVNPTYEPMFFLRLGKEIK